MARWRQGVRYPAPGTALTADPLIGGGADGQLASPHPGADVGPTDGRAGLDQVEPRPQTKRRRWIRIAGRASTPVISFGLLVGLWYLISAMVGARVLPTPHRTLAAVGKSLDDGVLWSDIYVTARRIAGAFALGLGAALVVGCALGLSKILGRLFGPWVTIAASVPSLLYLIVAYLWIGLTDRGAMVGVALIVMPMMTFAIWDGVKGLNPELGEMARAFGIPYRTVVRSVVLPQILPFVFTAARSGLSLTWRITIFAELIGRSSGVGYRIQYWYNLFNMERVLAAALPFVCLMLVLELAVLRPLESWLFRWRRAEMR